MFIRLAVLRDTNVPYYYGPYAENLADTLNFLVSMELVKEEKRLLRDNMYQYSYKLTPEGERLSSSIIRKSSQMSRRISLAVNEIKDLEIQGLVRFAKEAISQAGIS